jgi:magnesium-transporting ATPase (P-type)
MKGLIKSILELGKRLIESLENSDKPFFYFILAFLFIVMIRGFLEILVYYAPIEPFLTNSSFAHTYFFYASVITSIILVFYLVTGCPVVKITKTTAGFFSVIFLGPLWDFFSGSRVCMTYYLPDVHDNFIARFLMFPGCAHKIGITAGFDCSFRNFNVVINNHKEA